jgi:hypothetical protein
MQPVRYFQEGGEAEYGFYDPYYGDMYDSGSYYDDFEPLSQEEYDQQEAEYYGLTVDELRNYRQQQAGIGALPAGQETAGDAPYVASATTSTTTRDPALQQLLFGLVDPETGQAEGGFIPGAMRAAERTFFDEEGRPVIVPQEVAGLTDDQLAAAQQARDLVGVQDRFISDAESAYRAGIDQLGAGQEAARGFGMRGLEAVESGVGEEARLRRSGLEGLLSSIGEGRQITRGATGDLMSRLGETEDIRRGSALGFGQRLGESEELLRGTTGAYDQDLTKQFMDPYEDAVVQQTVEDAVKQANIADIAQTARDIRSGGESAFGSRARLSADERTEALGRGLAKEIAGIRSRGFSQAQSAGLGEFARQQQAARSASAGLAGLAGQRLGAGQQLASGLGQSAQQRFGAGTGLGQALVGFGQTGQQAQAGAGQAALGAGQQLAGALGQMGGLESQIGQQRFQAQQGLGGFLQGLGGQAQQAGMAGVNLLSGIGGQQQALQQQILNAQRANALQAQQAPLQQYQALLPFIGTATQTAGQQSNVQQFAPPPSPLMAGLGVGLSTLGGIGSFMNQGQRAV